METPFPNFCYPVLNVYWLPGPVVDTFSPLMNSSNLMKEELLLSLFYDKETFKIQDIK